MEAYGFSDYFGIGDIIAHTQGGYLHDGVTAAMGASWLRGKGRELSAAGKPWFLAVNFVNPHDVMFYDTDAPGAPVQPHRGLSHVARDPVDPLYAKKWEFALPRTTSSRSTRPGVPRRITISCACTMPWPAKIPTRNRAGAGDTTTT